MWQVDDDGMEVSGEHFFQNLINPILSSHNLQSPSCHHIMLFQNATEPTPKLRISQPEITLFHPYNHIFTNYKTRTRI